MTRPAFTLVELLVSIVVTSVVALLVYGAAESGFSTRARLEREHRALQGSRATRLVLQEALRNAHPAARPGAPAFVVEDRRDARGRPADRLRFVAGGGFPPLTEDAEWLVQLAPDTAGVVLSALPLGVRGAPVRTLGRFPGATGVDVRVRALSSDEWTDRWAYVSVVPAGVEVTFTSDSGLAGLPIHVALPLGGAP